MIEEPPPIVFASSIERPSADVVERFRAPTSFIVDAMNGTGALDWRIKRLVGGSLVGVALKRDWTPQDQQSVVEALADQTGRVFMVATNGYVAAAVTGDLLLYVARRGRRGVTDGLVRDLDDLEKSVCRRCHGRYANSPQGADAQSACQSVAAWRSPRRWWSATATASWCALTGARDLERVKAMEAATLERVRGGLKELPVEVPAARRMGRGEEQPIRFRAGGVRRRFPIIDLTSISSTSGGSPIPGQRTRWRSRATGPWTTSPTERSPMSLKDSSSWGRCRHAAISRRSRVGGRTRGRRSPRARRRRLSPARARAIDRARDRAGSQAQDGARGAPPNPESARPRVHAQARLSRSA